MQNKICFNEYFLLKKYPQVNGKLHKFRLLPSQCGEPAVNWKTQQSSLAYKAMK